MTEPTSTPPTQQPEAPTPFSLAWYDALIADKQQQAENLFAQFNQTRGVVETLINMRALAVEQEAKEKAKGST